MIHACDEPRSTMHGAVIWTAKEDLVPQDRLRPKWALGQYTPQHNIAGSKTCNDMCGHLT